MTPLTTPIFDFHYVISTLMTPTMTLTPTPLLMKTSLNMWDFYVHLEDFVWGVG